VDANRAPEDADLADALLGNPAAATLRQIASAGSSDLKDFLGERRNYRQIPHRMEEPGSPRRWLLPEGDIRVVISAGW
jgi:hypothetical protein